MGKFMELILFLHAKIRNMCHENYTNFPLRKLVKVLLLHRKHILTGIKAVELLSAQLVFKDEIFICFQR